MKAIKNNIPTDHFIKALYNSILKHFILTIPTIPTKNNIV